ncbi:MULTISPECIES: PRTRC system ParB family protein [Sphingomonas]|uniref:PRTRC system ParB family protein n=1 Tax=Sphingomonas TaxID=13687 RepID=UPI00254B3C17|nr:MULTISPECIES: PRTRC system ParB family protein [Sphingomonas]MDK8187751.1 PRTRC system ParB family protein [Sphingomonas zeae]MDK8217606.1 PRTRC system ParB family protein [Sphingomonas sp. UMB7805-LC452B]
MLALSSMRPGANPRRYFDEKTHAEMVASLKLRGMLQPILLRPDPTEDGAYQIVAGGRRHRAALEAFGADGVVPVRILAMTDNEALEAAIDENDIRDDASETEQADAAVRILSACQGDRAEAARRLAWSPAKLDRRLALANLAEPVKIALDQRQIKVGHAELLAAVPGDKQAKALETITTAGLDVAKTRELLMRVTQSLAAATFDKTECLTCPFNSGSQRALFETHVDDGHCTNPGCYQLKAEAASVGKDLSVRGDQLAPASIPATAPAGRGQAAAPAAAKPAPSPAAPQPTVTAKTLAAKTMTIRDAAWRVALVKAVEGDPDIGRAFEATLRDTWKVDATFLGRFGKDELKFIARECGLIAHMGEKAFAKLLEAKIPDIIAGMLNAKGFRWDGRLPSAMTLDGSYGAPPAAAALAYKD